MTVLQMATMLLSGVYMYSYMGMYLLLPARGQYTIKGIQYLIYVINRFIGIAVNATHKYAFFLGQNTTNTLPDTSKYIMSRVYEG